MFSVQCSVFGVVAIAAALGSALDAAELKVDLNPPDRRGEALSPHWENWACKEGSALSNSFDGISVVFRTEKGGTISPVLYKATLDYGAHMAADGIATKPGPNAGGLEMVIGGLSAGNHHLVTYHNELRDLAPTALKVLAGGTVKVEGLLPSKRATNDYEVANAYFEVDAVAGKKVVIHFLAADPTKGGSVMINGFELDTVDPHKKATKPFPMDDDEHVAPETTLSWTAAQGAVSQRIYFGTDSNAVACATPTSPEFQGKAQEARFDLQGASTQKAKARGLNHRQSYFWRVDEVDANGVATHGEVWRFQTRFPAFATAEGYGRFAHGGRGGRVIEVTNLEDYDPSKGEAIIPGSFRAAVEAEGPRTIIFRLSGLIRLKRPCAVSKPYCTIAGQTAPGDGICLANYSAGAFGTHDVIIRYMRFRIGDSAKKAMDGAGMGSCDHCIMDHCSISWSSDEATSSRGARNITFQRNIVAEALHHSYHYRASDRTKFETHAFAGSISGNIGSFHHNLLADCTDRNWSLAGGYNQGGMYTGMLDIRNNVVYNWTARTTDGGVAQMNYVNNYYKPNSKNPFVKWLLKLDRIDPAHGAEYYFMTGNVMEGQDYEQDNWKAFQNGTEVEKLVRVNQPLFESYVKTHSAREAFTNVLADVGATFPKQDAIDRRLIEDARTGTARYAGTKGANYGDRPSRNFAGIIDEPTDDKDAQGSPNFPWPEYRTYNVPVDSDHDGMPDEWEKRAGLDPKNPNDRNQDRDGDGYTNLEKYLGWLVGEYPEPEKVRGKTRVSAVAP